MLYVIGWIAIGLVAFVWGYITDEDRSEHSAIIRVLAAILCMLFGPLSLVPLFETLSAQAYRYEIPWYKQGLQMAREKKKFLADWKDFIKEAKETITTVKSRVVTNDGNSYDFVQSFSAEYDHWGWRTPRHKWKIRPVSEKTAQTLFKNSLKDGYRVGERFYPYHAIVKIEFI